MDKKPIFLPIKESRRSIYMLKKCPLFCVGVGSKWNQNFSSLPLSKPTRIPARHCQLGDPTGPKSCLHEQVFLAKFS